jgi:hypothetical protein
MDVFKLNRLSITESFQKFYPKNPRHLYRGHRRASFVAHDLSELGKSPPLIRGRVFLFLTVLVQYILAVELRARQRTFEGAYGRTALGTLGYAIIVLRLFDTRFYKSEFACALR